MEPEINDFGLENVAQECSKQELQQNVELAQISKVGIKSGITEKFHEIPVTAFNKYDEMLSNELEPLVKIKESEALDDSESESNEIGQDKHNVQRVAKNQQFCNKAIQKRRGRRGQLHDVHTSSSSKSNLKKPIRVNKNPKKRKVFKCDQCDYETPQEIFLRKHLLRHKNSKEFGMFKCELCDYKTVHKDNLDIHLSQHKNPEEVPMFKCDQRQSFQGSYLTFIGGT